MTDKEQVNKCQCSCDDCGAECEPFWKKENKKQIIVDGVDVSDCNYIIAYDPSKEQGTWGGAIHKGACRIYSKDCKYNPSCYFKQLALKTQECEELKEENQKLEMQLCNNCGERDDYNIPCKMIRDLGYGLQKEIEENDLYRNALDEIGKIVKINCEEICGRKFEDCKDFLCSSKNILDIINKTKE